MKHNARQTLLQIDAEDGSEATQGKIVRKVISKCVLLQNLDFFQN